MSKVKSFTVLFDLRNEDWTHDVENVIREYFMDPEEELLVIYFNELSLCATFDYPEVPVHDMMYFLKEKNKVITPENFHEEVTFGNFNNSVEGDYHF